VKEDGTDAKGDDGDDEEIAELAARYVSRAAAAGVRYRVLW
jgi:hypothetical protein